MPSASNMAISFTSTPGSITTPLPMTGTAFSYMTPEGMRCSASFLSPCTTVCPALFPPW